MLRTAPIPRSGGRTEDIKKDFSPDQLQSIGAIAMAWNDVEHTLNCLLYSGLNLSGSSWVDILSRLTIDAKIELVFSAEETLYFPAQLRDIIQHTVESTKELKLLRNSVVHARIYDAATGVGENVKRGGKISQVLLVEPALDNLYRRLVILRGELRSVVAIFDLLKSDIMNVLQGGKTWDQLIAGEQVSHWLDNLKQLQSEQLKLYKSMPSFD